MDFTLKSKKHGTFIVTVDDIDSDLFTLYSYQVAKHREGVYYVRRYIYENRKIKTFFLHKDIGARMGLSNDKQIDHKSRDRMDNRRSNLREATHQENNRNKSRKSNNTSGVPGVHLCKRNKSNPYETYINFNKKRIHIGFFSTLEQAATAREEAEKKYFGEFAPAH